MAHDFITDLQKRREEARKHMEKGAVTPENEAKVATTVKILNEALATEIICVLRYKRHYYMAKGIHSESIKTEFLEHATEEEAHVNELASRITQLGGAPNFSPQGLMDRSHTEYIEGETIIDMIKEDLVAERVAISSYREMINYFKDSDPTTRRMLEGILAKEEEHADDLASLLQNLGGDRPYNA